MFKLYSRHDELHVQAGIKNVSSAKKSPKPHSVKSANHSKTNKSTQTTTAQDDSELNLQKRYLPICYIFDLQATLAMHTMC